MRKNLSVCLVTSAYCRKTVQMETQYIFHVYNILERSCSRVASGCGSHSGPVAADTWWCSFVLQFG